jgi:carbon storage regulator CsrA
LTYITSYATIYLVLPKVGRRHEALLFALAKELHMLVLSRKTGEWVRVADNLDIGVMSVKGNKVRLCFRIPAEIPVVRGELCDPPTLALPLPEKKRNRGKRWAASIAPKKQP